MQVRVLIVGAGIAGLSCFEALQHHNMIKTTVFEGHNYMGGRILTKSGL